MIFNIMSRFDAEIESKNRDMPATLVISITEEGSPYPEFDLKNPNIVDILFVQFNDVNADEPFPITEEHAKAIIEEYNLYKNKVERILVHCEAGVSRSAGVCAALMKIHDGDDMPIFGQAKYCPNMTCYRAILDEYYGKYDEEEAQRKWDVNTEAYLKEEGLLDD